MTFEFLDLEPGVYTNENGVPLVVERATPGTFTTAYSRGYTARGARTLTWTLPGGVTVTARETEDVNTTARRQGDGWYYLRRPERTSRVELLKKTRLYVSDDRPFDLREDLANRTRRPVDAWRAAARLALTLVGWDFERMTWSQYAGCSSCPCSPGFILEDGHRRGWSVLVKVPHVATVDLTKPARDVV